MDTFEIVVRMSSRDAHYGGDIVAGARLLELFGDAVTGLTAVRDGDEGLVANWEEVRFHKPVHPGDFIRVDARVLKTTRLRRSMKVTAHRIIRSPSNQHTSVEPVEPAECVADAAGVVVIPFAVARKWGGR
jgi:acyl dehydratase